MFKIQIIFTNLNWAKWVFKELITKLKTSIKESSCWLVSFITLPVIFVLVFSLPRMKLWWDQCSCLKTWCRTSGDKDMENERAWCECVRVDAYVQYNQSLLLYPSCPDVVWIQPETPTKTWMKGLDWSVFSLPVEIAPQYKVTDVTDLDGNTPSPVLKIDLLR